MQKTNYVAVTATEERFRALRHVPSNAGFDENGKGFWPADQFTFRMRNEGTITIQEDEPTPAAPPIVEPPLANEKRK